MNPIGVVTLALPLDASLDTSGPLCVYSTHSSRRIRESSLRH